MRSPERPSRDRRPGPRQHFCRRSPVLLRANFGEKTRTQRRSAVTTSARKRAAATAVASSRGGRPARVRQSPRHFVDRSPARRASDLDRSTNAGHRFAREAPLRRTKSPARRRSSPGAFLDARFRSILLTSMPIPANFPPVKPRPRAVPFPPRFRQLDLPDRFRPEASPRVVMLFAGGWWAPGSHRNLDCFPQNATHPNTPVYKPRSRIPTRL